jgi:hypothetical protein
LRDFIEILRIEFVKQLKRSGILAEKQTEHGQARTQPGIRYNLQRRISGRPNPMPRDRVFREINDVPGQMSALEAPTLASFFRAVGRPA